MLEDANARMFRIEALWMLLWPRIEEHARSLGATPAELAVALTVGTARCAIAASIKDSCKLFETALESLQHGDQ